MIIENDSAGLTQKRKQAFAPLLAHDPQIIFRKNNSGTSLFDMAVKTNCQFMLDYFYEAISQFYKVKGVFDYKKTDNAGYTLFHHAISLHQPVAVLEEASAEGKANIDQLTFDPENQNRHHSIHLAARAGNVSAMKWIKENTAQDGILNESSNFAVTPLICAAAKGQGNAVEYLLDEKVLLDAVGEIGGVSFTALHIAIRNGHFNVAASLINQGAALQFTSLTGHPIHAIEMACTEKAPNDLLEMIIARDPEAINRLAEKNPLIIATNKNYPRLVSYLIEKNVELRRAKEAAAGRQLSLADENAFLRVRDKKGSQAIHLACKNGQYEIAKLLLEKDPSLVSELETDTNCSPLVLAARYGHMNIANLILKMAKVPQANESSNHNIDLNAMLRVSNRHGNQAIHYACKKGQYELVQALLEEDASLVNEVGRGGYTPLILAAQYGHLDILRLLIKKAAESSVPLNVDAVTNTNGRLYLDGFSALHWAVQNHHVEMVRELVKAGADATLKNLVGETPLNVMENLPWKNCNTEIGGLLNLRKYEQEHAKRNKKQNYAYQGFKIFGLIGMKRVIPVTEFTLFGHVFNVSRKKKDLALKEIIKIAYEPITDNATITQKEEVTKKRVEESNLSLYRTAIEQGKLGKVASSLGIKCR